MDMNLILFIFITTCVLSLLTYAEWVYKRKKKESDRDIRIRRMNGWIDEARRQRKNKERAEKEGLINYLTKFKLEYDPSTHTYIKVETIRDEETEVIRLK